MKYRFVFGWFTLIGGVMLIVGFIWLIGNKFLKLPDLMRSVLTICSIVLVIIGGLCMTLVIVPSNDVSFCDSVPIQPVNLNNTTIYYGESFVTRNGDLLNEGDICVILIDNMAWFARGLPSDDTVVVDTDWLPCVKTYERYWDVSLLGLTPSFKIPRNDCLYELHVPKNSGNEMIPYINDNYRYRDPLSVMPEGSYLVSEFL